MNKNRDHTFHTITIVPLGTSFLEAPLLSEILISRIRMNLESQKKTLIFYNRRGSGRAFICQDCGYFPVCPHCDIALAYHTTPKDILICHHCNYIQNRSLVCLHCQGSRFQSVWVGVQKIEKDIVKIFPWISPFRVDSDTALKKSEILFSLKKSEVILSTHSSISLIHQDIDEVVFLLFESDLTLPDYRMEEDLYHMVDYVKKSGKSIIIQTYTPEHPLLEVIVKGNYKDFLNYIAPERKKFIYPPYAQFVLIRVHDISQEKVKDIIEKMVNKIDILKRKSTFFAYDRDIWEKYAGEWIQKIILKDEDLSYILSELEIEIVRNRAVTLEYR